jgi:hypothetical protein
VVDEFAGIVSLKTICSAISSIWQLASFVLNTNFVPNLMHDG